MDEKMRPDCVLPYFRCKDTHTGGEGIEKGIPRKQKPKESSGVYTASPHLMSLIGSEVKGKFCIIKLLL